MFARIFSTLVLWTITVLAIIYLKSLGWAAIICVLSAGALFETCKILDKMGASTLLKTAQFLNIGIFTAAWGFSYFGLSPFAGGAVMYALCCGFLAVSILRQPFGDYARKSVFPTILALTAISFPLQWLVILGAEMRSDISEYTGIVLAVWILAAAKFSDVGAYVIGAAFGRHKMAESISPKKTIEGAVGGLISSAAVSILFACGFAHILPEQFTPLAAAIGGAIIGAAAIFSDLLESVLKRTAKVKDSGNFIPGIGGALDLADSLLLTAPIGTLIISILV